MTSALQTIIALKKYIVSKEMNMSVSAKELLEQQISTPCAVVCHEKKSAELPESIYY